MNPGFFLILCLTLLYWATLPAQNAKDTLLHIISTSFDNITKQKKIDSLLEIYSVSITPESLADCYHNLGSRWYYTNWQNTRQPKDLDSAIVYTQRAAELKGTIENPDNASLKQSYYNLGYFFNLRNDSYKAVNAYRKVMENTEADALKALAAYRLGDLFRKLGDFHKALMSFNEALDMSTEVNLSEGDFLNILIGIAETYSNMGHESYKNEISNYLAIADSLNRNRVRNPFQQAAIDQLWGNLYLFLANFEKANDYHRRVQSASSTFSEDNLSALYNSLGVSYDKLGFDDRALELFRKSIEFNPEFSSPFENIGDLYLAENKFEQAMQNYHRAISINTNKNLGENPTNLPGVEEMELSLDKGILLNHLVTKANGWLRYYDYDHNNHHLANALETFETADQLIDIIRADNREFQSKLYWRQKSADLYMKAVQSCYLLDQPEKAYYFMERNKALLLLEDITHEQARDLSQLPERIAEREFELMRNTLLAEGRLNTLADSSQINVEDLKNDLAKRKRILEQFTDSVHQAFPDYARLKKQLPILPFEAFKQKYCRGKQAVLHYILNDAAGYGLYNDSNNKVFFKLEVEGDFNKQVDELYQQLTTFTPGRDATNAYRELARQVFDRLIPLEVYNEVKGKQLIIIPDHRLQKTPFDALVPPGDEATYLLEECEIQYAYSLSYLYAKSQVGAPSAEGLLAVAPVDFSALGLERLRFSEEEVNEIQAIYGGELLVNGTANKSQLLSRFSDSGILHFSTHADLEENGHHWVALRDEKLYLNEIYANKTNASMVVLSACNTSAGALRKGEGVMSLARAFFNSGAKSVVSSLWPIDDRAGKDLMVEFYRGLDKGLTKSAALRAAKLKFTRHNASLSPSYWAPLIVIGDNSPLSSPGFLDGNWKWILPVSVLIAFTAWRKFRSRAS